MTYTIEYLKSLNNSIVFLEPMYGMNKTRQKKRVIDIDGFLFYGVEHIKIEIDDIGVFISLLDTESNILVKRQLKQNEKFSVIENKITNTYKYSFNI